MELSQAKLFVYDDIDKTGYIYTSKHIDKILAQSDKHLYSVYAVCDTPSGEKMFDMDWSYSKDPIIMGVFLHYAFYKEAYDYKKWIDLDE